MSWNANVGFLNTRLEWEDTSKGISHTNNKGTIVGTPSCLISLATC